VRTGDDIDIDLTIAVGPSGDDDIVLGDSRQNQRGGRPLTSHSNNCGRPDLARLGSA
jgi:hypothetical protein